MTLYLNQKHLCQLQSTIKKPKNYQTNHSAVLHFGIGGFHRSHQALYFQQLRDMDPERFLSWSIVGACILPQDELFVQKMKQQDFLYTLKSSSSDGKEEVRIISSITNIFYGPTESENIINTIASLKTEIVSFTITEGGYMIDEATGKFEFDHPDIVSDLLGRETPKTVFGYLAKGLTRRRKIGTKTITFLSCDNVQENGQVLRQALIAFLQKYDKTLISYVLKYVNFPNSMVDRITPITTEKDRNDFEKKYGYRDECLVISEDFSQWIIEETGIPKFTPLQEVGVIIVKDVRPYEKMKLRILNGGHSLVGLLGKALGYQYIHDAIKDEHISAIFDRYIEQEVIPSLTEIKDYSFSSYMLHVKSRFNNEIIQDEINRIINFSSAKIPKFILPVMEHSLKTERLYLISSLIVSAWWYYLSETLRGNRSDEIIDSMKPHWNNIFIKNREDSVVPFVQTQEVFGNLGDDARVQEQVKRLTEIIESKGMIQAIKIVASSQN